MFKTSIRHLLVVAGILNCGLACAKSGASDPLLYIANTSHGHRILIHVDGNIVWDAIVPQGNASPYILPVGILKNVRKTSTFAITGGPYNVKETVDWRKGPRVVLFFEKDGRVIFSQDDGKAGFQ